MSDEAVIALLEGLDLKSRALGPRGPHGETSSVYLIAPDTVLKITCLDQSHEALAMYYVAQQTSIPVPQLRKIVNWNSLLYVFMDYVEGSDLRDVWPSLSLWRRIKVAWTLRGYIRQLRAMDLPNKDVPGPLHFEGRSPSRCEGHYFAEYGSGPFESYAALTAWYEKRRRFHNLLVRSRIRDGSKYEDTTQPFDDSMPLVLTHGDISVNNVRLGVDGKLWLLDWQFSGLYPKWFEYACIMAYERGQPKALPGWLALAPLMAGWFEPQLQFMRDNLTGITHVGYRGYE